MLTLSRCCLFLRHSMELLDQRSDPEGKFVTFVLTQRASSAAWGKEVIRTPTGRPRTVLNDEKNSETSYPNLVTCSANAPLHASLHLL